MTRETIAVVTRSAKNCEPEETITVYRLPGIPFAGMSSQLNAMDDAHRLDDRALAVVRRVADAERAAALVLPTDDPLDPRRRFRTEATRAELLAQPEVVARN
jgi:hypothetical protein